MMTREEIYGGSVVIEYQADLETFQLPPHFDIKVVHLSVIDIVVTGFTLRLPDPQTIRQHGWLVFFLYNATGAPVAIETATGTALGTLPNGRSFSVGLLSAEFPVGGGTWILVQKDTNTAVGSQMTRSVNFGSTSGLGDDVEGYLFNQDSWLTFTDLPNLSGTGVEIGAAEHPDGSTGFDCYYGQLENFYRWNNGINTLKTAPNYDFAQTGLGVITGSALGDMLHVANAGLAPLDAYKMEVYGVSGDAWTLGVNFPPVTGLTAPEVTVCQSIGIEGANRWAFFSPSTLDSSVVFMAYDQISGGYSLAAYPPIPRGPYRPSCIGIDNRLHFMHGSYSETAGVIASTFSHQEFSPDLNTWQTLPPSPVIGRGLGILGLGDPRDRFTFGMGETTSVPSEVHFEYNITTRTYRARATFTWGTGREERESAWGMFKV